jgi:hypothetical protein
MAWIQARVAAWFVGLLASGPAVLVGAAAASAAEVVIYSARHYGQEAAFEAFTKKTEFLSSPEAQQMFADLSFEYPANPQAAIHPLVAKWGTFKHDDINIAAAGEFQAAAVSPTVPGTSSRRAGASWTPTVSRPASLLEMRVSRVEHAPRLRSRA